MTRKRLIESRKQFHPLFSERGEIAANATKHDNTLLAAKTSRDFLLDLDHPKVALRLVVGLSRQLHRLHL